MDINVNKNLSEIYNNYLNEFNSDELLKSHRFFVEQNNLGFGERAFHALWKEIISNQPNEFKFLEIGVYKGQILSLVKLLSDNTHKNIEFYGVSPFNETGDKYSNYEKTDYIGKIKMIFENFNLDLDISKNLIKGDSTDNNIKEIIMSKGKFDVIYIDGCHDYSCVCSDIELSKKIIKDGGFIIFDDASCFKNLPDNFFKGHHEVCKSIESNMENDNSFKEIITVGHNRVFKKI
jgi:hypothetical protein